MYNIMSIVEELQAESSRNGKESILKREEGNIEWKMFLNYTHNPALVYGIQAGKLKKFINKGHTDTSFHSLFEVFEYLLENSTGNDNTAKLVATFIDSQPDDMKQFYLESITKTLRMGFNVSTIQKVYPDLIEKFEVQRAKSYTLYAKKLLGKMFSLSEKKNGIRCITEVKNGKITNKTRQNNLIHGLNDINKEMAALPDGIYDGELVTKDEDKFRLRNILQETKKIVNSDMENKVVNYWIFDYLTLDEFRAGKSKLNYFKRRDNNPVNGTNLESVKMIPELYRGDDVSVIAPFLDDLVDTQGREGLMYYQDKPYTSKRTDNILKVKKKYSSDLRVIGFREGKGANKGMLGALVLDYKGYDLGCDGMSKPMRKKIWDNQEDYLGVIVEVEHEQETINTDGGLSLEYPDFVDFRFDKDEVNYAHE